MIRTVNEAVFLETAGDIDAFFLRFLPFNKKSQPRLLRVGSLRLKSMRIPSRQFRSFWALLQRILLYRATEGA
jgi:hypothetical protein